ncbi:hypothetical protein [Pedobacter sp.]|uniref:hypothetical protein n=1 Tax=Pedobacter sp. TaxID=1411316 RepID=UPI003BA965BB
MDKLLVQKQLKLGVLRKCGLKQFDESHCGLISEQVFLQTKNYISRSGVCRFYLYEGEHPQFNSPFILNSLSQFIGYTDFAAYGLALESRKQGEPSLNFKSKAGT